MTNRADFLTTCADCGRVYHNLGTRRKACPYCHPNQQPGVLTA